MRTAVLLAAWLCTCLVSAWAGEKSAMEQAVNEYKSGLFMRARNRLEGILKKAPQDAGAHYLLACILVKQKHNDLARAHFKYCLQICPKEKNRELFEKANAAIRELDKSATVALPSPGLRPEPEQEDHRPALEAEGVRLRGEAEGQIAVKKKILSDKIADLLEQEKQALAPLAPVRRRHGGRYVDQEAVDSIKKDYSERRRALELQFEKDANLIRQSFERRLQGYEEALKAK
ncbi:MAG: hypothetical protein SFV17_15135 [Candidatus Obscuribacter sp.]|nr:hypothetical protein [Candidatus Obscuribacter sp.]